MSETKKRAYGQQPNVEKPVDLPTPPQSGSGQFRPPNIVMQRGTPPFPADLLKALDEAKRNGNYYIIVCKASDSTADAGIQIFSTRSAGFHRGNLVRAWQKAGAQILDFTQEMFFSAVHRFIPQLASVISAELAKDTGGPQNVEGSIEGTTAESQDV